MTGLRAAAGLFALGVTVLAFATPLRELWMRPGVAWWTPFALWLAATVALAVAASSTRGRDGRR